ncbi:MAG: HIT family protein [Saprospiraceae bacterium]
MTDFYCEQIITGKTNVDVIFETEMVMAFHHTKPYWEKHVVIIPKTHIDSLSKYPNSEKLNRAFFEAIKFVTQLFEESYGGCRISSNVGNYQTTKHLHWYVHHGPRLRTENGDPIS